MAGLFLVLQAWSELTYASFLLLFFGLAALFAMWSAFKGEVKWGTLIGGWFTAAVVFVVGIAPFLWAMLPDLRSEGDGSAIANSPRRSSASLAMCARASFVTHRFRCSISPSASGRAVPTTWRCE